jgi:hypothetical protein
MINKELELIGYCPVDSGQIILVDPCYLNTWKGGYFDSKSPKDNDYQRACEITLKNKHAGQTFNNMAVVTSTCWGDGQYPVYVTRNREGRISSVIIDFDDVYGDPEDYE